MIFVSKYRYFVSCSSFQYVSAIGFGGLILANNVIDSLLHDSYYVVGSLLTRLIGGFGNALLPLLLLSSDMVLPRVNNMSLWYCVVHIVNKIRYCWWLYCIWAVNSTEAITTTAHCSLSTSSLLSTGILISFRVLVIQEDVVLP